jgi:hypothetical protein
LQMSAAIALALWNWPRGGGCIGPVDSALPFHLFIFFTSPAFQITVRYLSGFYNTFIVTQMRLVLFPQRQQTTRVA